MVTKPKVFWSDAEEERFLEILLPLYVRNPGVQFKQLCLKAMAQMPKDRQRSLQSVFFQRIIPKLKERTVELLELPDEVSRLRDRVHTTREQTTTKEDVLSSMTDWEVVTRFGSTIMGKLMQLLIDRALETAPLSAKLGNTHVGAPIVRKTRVGVVGVEGKRVGQLQRKLPEVEIVEVPPRVKAPPQCELYVVWVNFVAHTAYANVPNPVLVKGGINTLADRIRHHLNGA